MRLTILFLFLPLLAWTQNFTDQSTKWIEHNYVINDNGDDQLFEVATEIMGDSVIEGKTYFRMLSQYDEYAVDDIGMETLVYSELTEWFMREEAEVFYRWTDAMEEQAFFNFDLEIGDVLYFPETLDNAWEVVSIGERLIAGEMRDTFALLNNFNQESFSLIAGVGSDRSFFFGANPPCCQMEEIPFVDCYAKSNTSTALHAGAEGCETLITSNQEINATPSGFSIYPNPSADEVVVDVIQGSNARVLIIYSIEGKELWRYQIVSGLNTLNISSLDQGLYVICGIDDKGQPVAWEKLVVARF